MTDENIKYINLNDFYNLLKKNEEDLSGRSYSSFLGQIIFKTDAYDVRFSPTTQNNKNCLTYKITENENLSGKHVPLFLEDVILPVEISVKGNKGEIYSPIIFYNIIENSNDLKSICFSYDENFENIELSVWEQINNKSSEYEIKIKDLQDLMNTLEIVNQFINDDSLKSEVFRNYRDHEYNIREYNSDVYENEMMNRGM